MATLTLTDDIPNGTELVALITQAELETYLLDGTSGFFTYDIDQAAEVSESDLILNITGSGMASIPFPQGTMDGGTFTNIDTGLDWATIAGLPDLDVTQLIILAANPATTLQDYGDFFFGGKDVMNGAGADDILNGFSGSDAISGAGGSDYLIGGKGSDILDGGKGRDRLVGNGGADTFVFDAGLTRANADRIVKFNPDQDIILLDATIFTGIGTTLDGIEYVMGPSAESENSRIIYNEFTGKIYFDSDGTGASQQRLFATIDTHADLGEFAFEMLV